MNDVLKRTLLLFIGTILSLLASSRRNKVLLALCFSLRLSRISYEQKSRHGDRINMGYIILLKNE
jgi:hypothetical protein